MFHDGAHDQGFEKLPITIAFFGGSDALRFQNHSRHAVDSKQTKGQGRFPALLDSGKFHPARIQNGFTWEKNQAVGIGKGFGLNKHLEISWRKTDGSGFCSLLNII